MSVKKTDERRRCRVCRLIDRFLDWMCDRIGLCIRFDGDLMTPDWNEGDGDPHYRPERATIRFRRNG